MRPLIKLMKRALALACLLSLCLSLFACHRNKTQRFSATTLEYFDTVCVIYGYEKDRAAFNLVADEVFAKLEYYHKLFDIYREYDGITNAATLNHYAGNGEFFEVDKPLYDLLALGKEMYTLTGGAMNIAMGSVLSIWHNYREAGINYPDVAAIPTEAELAAASMHTSIEALELEPNGSLARLADPDASLDFGALAKGYAADLIMRFLREEGYENGYAVSLGGNVATLGKRGDEQPFTVGIENPLDAANYVARLSLTNASLVTSGSYQRYYTVNGQTYHHIIDPETLYPADKGYISVSVYCESSALADALSTALFILEQEAGLALIESIEGAEALWLYENGTVARSSGFAQYEIQN
ncbi:MAG: FAD:protein FMN transferase [Clostridia bacterium]|nr:FAD:protein FMN transferase [Clostridia bacterium]